MTSIIVPQATTEYPRILCGLALTWVRSLAGHDLFRDIQHIIGLTVVIADESFRSLDLTAHTRLWMWQVVMQLLRGTVTSIALLALTQILKLTHTAHKRIYALARCMTVIVIFVMGWNAASGGPPSCKTLLGYATYKTGFAMREGLPTAIALLILPFFVSWVLLKLLLPWPDADLLPASSAPAHGPT